MNRIALKKICASSIFLKFFGKIYDCIMKFVYSSFLYRIFFYELGFSNFFRESICYRVSKYFLKIMGCTRSTLSKFFRDSFIYRLSEKIFVPYIPQVFLDSFLFKILSEFFGIKFTRCEKKSGLITVLIFFVSSLFLSLIFGFKAFVLVMGFYFSLWILHNPRFGIFCLAFVLPLIKTKFILTLVVLTVMSFLFKLLFTDEFSFSVNLLDLFVVLFIFLICYTICISYIPSDSLKMGGVYLLFVFLYFAVRNILNSKEDLFSVISIMVLSSVFVAAFGIAQKYLGLGVGAQMWIDEKMFENNTFRVYSTLDNPNVLGEYLLFALPISFAGIYYHKNKLLKIISGLIFSLLCVCMLLTLSRGAWLGLIAGMTVFFMLRDKKFLLIGLVLALFMPIIIPESFITRFMSIGNLADSSTSYRLSIWIGSLRMRRDFWPIGIGLGTDVFIYIFQKYALSASYALHSHNFYMQLIIDLGITGFIITSIIIFMTYKNLLVNNKFQSDNFIKTIKAALCAGLTGYLLQGLTDNIWYNYRMVLFFWFIVAIASVCFNLSKLSVWGKFKLFQHTTKFNTQ